MRSVDVSVDLLFELMLSTAGDLLASSCIIELVTRTSCVAPSNIIVEFFGFGWPWKVLGQSMDFLGRCCNNKAQEPLHAPHPH